MGLDDRRGLFQPERFCDCLALHLLKVLHLLSTLISAVFYVHSILRIPGKKDNLPLMSHSKLEEEQIRTHISWDFVPVLSPVIAQWEARS